jgi:hypothetical protein
MAIMITIPIHAQEEYKQYAFMITFNTGNLSYGKNFPSNDGYDKELTLTLLNIGVIHKNTNIGFEYAPFKYFKWENASEYNNNSTGYSFANFKLFWNVLEGGWIYLGPFTSIDYLFVEEKVNWNRYVFTGGLHFGFRMNIGRFNYNLFSAGMGYKNIDGRSKYFIEAKIDVGILMAIVASIAYIISPKDKD